MRGKGSQVLFFIHREWIIENGFERQEFQHQKFTYSEFELRYKRHYGDATPSVNMGVNTFEHEPSAFGNAKTGIVGLSNRYLHTFVGHGSVTGATQSA